MCDLPWGKGMGTTVYGYQMENRTVGSFLDVILA